MARSRGFTLVELLVVIIVIAIIAALAVPKFASRVYRSRESRLRGDLQTLRNALERFHMDTGVWPATINHLARTTAPATCIDDDATPSAVAWPAGVSWQGPYVTNAHGCAIGSYDYQVVRVGNHNEARVNSDSSAIGSNGVSYDQW